MRSGYVISAVFLIAFGGFWVSLVALFDRQAFDQIAGQMAATHYPSTTGEITHSEVSIHQGSKSTTYHPQLRYRYQVNGHTWMGDRFRYDDGGSSEYAWAQQVVAEHPVGAQVQVFYYPKSAMDAVLSTGLEGSDLALVLFLTPFNMVGIGLFYGAVSLLRSAMSSSVAGGVKIIKDGFRLRARLPVFTPFPLALLVTGGVAFLSIFAIMIPFGFHAPLHVPASALAVAYGAGVVAFALQWRKIAAGEDDLVVDTGTRTLELPRTYHRRERVTVGFSDVAAVTVEIKVTQGKNGPHYSYLPTLQVRNGRAEGETLMSRGNREQADAFAEWLRGQLRLAQG